MTPIWENLLKTALVGTERQPLNFTYNGEVLDRTLARLDTAERETALLKAAGAAALYQRAGTLPATSAPVAAACELNDLPAISERTALHLRRMLQDSRYQALLPEWLAAVVQSQRRLPATALPQLLQLGANKPDLRDALLPALGARGRWLAGQHPSGQWVTGAEADESIWHEGTFEQRCAYLKQLRLRDAEKARTLLQATWEQEAPKERAAFLATLCRGLSMADEAFLESALDDKRKEVRTEALELLARLPDSAFVQRMCERARDVLTFKRGKFGKHELEINPPKECDQTMLRDGFEKNANAITADQRATWVHTILAVVPLSFWQETLQATPLEIVTVAVTKRNWNTGIFQCWAKAYSRHPDDAWAQALLHAMSEKNWHNAVKEVLQALNSAQLETLIWQLGEEKKLFDPKSATGLLLPQLTTTWSETLSQKLIEAIAHQCHAAANKQNYWYAGYSDALAQSLAPAVYDFAAATLTPYVQAEHDGAPALQHLLDILQFRYEMLKEIAQ